MEISKISVNGTNYDIVDTVTSINGKTGAISASDINAVLSDAGYDISGSAGYTAGTGISISELNAISVTYGNTSGTACQGNDSRLSDSRPASDVSAWAKAETKPTYSYSEITNTPSSLPASDVSSWAKANSKPSYNLDEVTDGTSRKIPTKVSELTNDSGYLTSHQSLSGYATESWVGQQGYLTSHQSLSGYATESWVSSKFNDVLGIDASGVSDLVSILSDNDTATGILNVIASKANASSIPTKVSDLTNDTGFITSYTNTVTSINGKTGEIAAADMAAVLTAAGYALTDTNTWPTALSQLSNDVGYITGITSSMVTTALGYTPVATDTNTWRPITNTYTGSDEGTSLSQYGANALYNDLVNGYAAEAGYATSAGGLNYKSAVESSNALDAAHWANQLNAYIFNGFNTSILSNNGIIIDGGWTNAIYGFQILIDDDPTYVMGLRQRNGDGWNDWKRIPMGDGTGASGTWGINITGSAGSASSANYATTAGSAPASDVYSWAKASTKPSYTKSEIGLGNVDNTADADKSVNYANSASNADTVDNFHASDLVKFYLSPMSGDAPADSAKSWFTDTMPSSAGAIVYNVPGSEKTIIVGKSSGSYGHMLQLGYDDTYLRILRYAGGSWKSTDWEKISAGYADSSGYASSAGSAPASDVYPWAKLSSKPSYSYSEISGRPTKLSDLTNDVGYITSYTDTNTWRPITDTYTGSDTGTSVSQAGTNALYNALVNGYASSAGNADTVDSQHFSYSNDDNAPTYLWATNSNGTSFLAHRASMSVNYANSAGSAPASDVYSWAKASTKPSYSYSEISGTPGSLPASDVYSWAKASSKPSYAYSEIGYSAYTATTSGALTLDGSTYPLCCITLNGNISSVAFSSYPPAGHSCHIIFNNTSSSDYTVAIAHGTLKCPEGQDISLTVKAGGYAEIDVLHVANVAYFVRGV